MLKPLFAITPALAIGLSLAPVAGALPGEYVRTESGRVHCYITTEHVACETGGIGFLNAPMMESSPDQHCHDASMTADGDFQWVVGNLGGSETADQNVLHYGAPIHMYGWTILPNEDGTLFTNDATGNGMFVSVEQTNPVQ